MAPVAERAGQALRGGGRQRRAGRQEQCAGRRTHVPDHHHAFLQLAGGYAFGRDRTRDAGAREGNAVRAAERPAAALAGRKQILVGGDTDGHARAVGERGALERSCSDVGELAKRVSHLCDERLCSRSVGSHRQTDLDPLVDEGDGDMAGVDDL
jgi:hypothetical protein